MMFLIEKALALLPSVKFVAENLVPLEGLLSQRWSHMSMRVNLLEN